MGVVIIEYGEADEPVLVLEFRFLEYLVEQPGNMRWWVAECSTA